jgi:transcriptional regulator GlxA family with amidase domain
MTSILAERGRLRESADRYLVECFARQTVPHVNEFARQIDVPQRSLGRWFVAETGMRIARYFKNAQVERAKELLTTTDLPVSAIADAAAFGTRMTFFRAFKRATGMTPDEFRSRQRLLVQ